jgi:hypothetical protein
VNEKLNNIATLETTKQEEAYTTSNLSKLIDKVFTQLKTVACDFPLLQKHTHTHNLSYVYKTCKQIYTQIVVQA